MLYTIKNHFKYISYYHDEDFVRITNKVYKTNNNDYILAVYEAINAIDQVFINPNKNVVLFQIDKKEIKNTNDDHKTIFYKFLYDGKLMWIDSYYTERL